MRERGSMGGGRERYVYIGGWREVVREGGEGEGKARGSK